MEAKRIINGTFGEAWFDDERLSEVRALQAKIDIKKETVNLCGQLGEHTKMTGWTGKGTLKLHKVNSRMLIRMNEMIKDGKDVKVKVISKLADPDSYGSERIVLGGVSFDDLTLVDWEAAKNGEVDAPFTFSSFEVMDKIEVK